MTETVLNRSPLAPAISPRLSARSPARGSRREPLSAALIYSAIRKYLKTSANHKDVFVFDPLHKGHE
jgi:hypothetical protein